MDEKMIDQLVEKTGLPKELVAREFKKWILEKGENPQTISLEGIREILVQITQEIFSDLAEGKNSWL